MSGETLIVSEEVNEICEEFASQLYGLNHRKPSQCFYFTLPFIMCYVSGYKITFTSSRQIKFP